MNLMMKVSMARLDQWMICDIRHGASLLLGSDYMFCYAMA